MVLCVTEITSWGVLYYALPVLAPAIAADTGWSVPAVTGAFSAGLVVSALVGVPVGRWLDRIGPRLVMTAGSVLAVPAVAVIALAGSYPVFVAGWLLAGVAMAGTLYPPAFAALTRWWGPRRVTALTGLTLLAGLASTVPSAAIRRSSCCWPGLQAAERCSRSAASRDRPASLTRRRQRSTGRPVSIDASHDLCREIVGRNTSARGGGPIGVKRGRQPRKRPRGWSYELAVDGLEADACRAGGRGGRRRRRSRFRTAAADG